MPEKERRLVMMYPFLSSLLKADFIQQNVICLLTKMMKLPDMII